MNCFIQSVLSLLSSYLFINVIGCIYAFLHYTLISPNTEQPKPLILPPRMSQTTYRITQSSVDIKRWWHLSICTLKLATQCYSWSQQSQGTGHNAVIAAIVKYLQTENVDWVFTHHLTQMEINIIIGKITQNS